MELSSADETDSVLVLQEHLSLLHTGAYTWRQVRTPGVRCVHLASGAYTWRQVHTPGMPSKVVGWIRVVNSCKREVIMHSVASLCLRVCNALTFESLDRESSYLVCKYIFRIS